MRPNVLAWTLATVALSVAVGCGPEKDARPASVAKAAAVEPPRPETIPAPIVPPPATPAPAPAPKEIEPPASAPTPPVVAPETPPAPLPATQPPVKSEPPKPDPAPTPPAPVPPAPRAADPPATPPTVPPTQGPGVWKDPFVGSNACQKCHFAEHRSWKKTSLARSLDALRPTAAADAVRFAAKTRAGLEPSRDYTAVEACLACHTTGYGGENGYPASSGTTGCVSCEGCHGPGGRYVAHKTEAIAKDKDAKFPRDELVRLGLVIPDAAVCARCHNDRSPTHADERFDFDAAKAKVHDHPKR